MADKDFTPREMEIMAKAWLCMSEEPKVDFKKLAELCGMGNTGSASNAWRNIKNKILAKGGQTPTTTPKKRGHTATKGKGGDDDESPTKKVKGGGKGKKGKRNTTPDENDDDELDKKEDAEDYIKADPESFF